MRRLGLVAAVAAIVVAAAFPTAASEGADSYEVEFNQAIATFDGDGSFGYVYVAERIWDGSRYVFMIYEGQTPDGWCGWSGDVTDTADLRIASHSVSVGATLDLRCGTETVATEVNAEWLWSGSLNVSTRVTHNSNPYEGGLRSANDTIKSPELDLATLVVDGEANAGSWWGAVQLEREHLTFAPYLPDAGQDRYEVVEQVEVVVTRVDAEHFEFRYTAQDGSDCGFLGIYASDPQEGPIGGYWYNPVVDRNGLLGLLSAGTWAHFQTDQCGANGGDYGARGLYAQLSGLEVGESFRVTAPTFRVCEAPEPNGC